MLSALRAMRGFQGPKDIFRNPEAVFRRFEPTDDDRSPFELALSYKGEKFTIMGMHLKLGLYEHQSAGAIQGVFDLLGKHPSLVEDNSGENIRDVQITAYEPAFSIIGDPAKRDPTTRQSADHSMVYIVSTLLRKALETGQPTWWELMLTPDDYRERAIHHPLTRKLMERVRFVHGGPEYDRRYPEGIPTSVVIRDAKGTSFDSGLVMFPAGHARDTGGELEVMKKEGGTQSLLEQMQTRKELYELLDYVPGQPWEYPSSPGRDDE